MGEESAAYDPRVYQTLLADGHKGEEKRRLALPHDCCPRCGYCFDEGDGLPVLLPVEALICPRCGRQSGLDELITEDDDYEWVG